MKVLLILLAVSSGEALASGGRSLPAGAGDPAVIERVFSSPRGEVQFVSVAGGHSAFLRNNRGNLAPLKEVLGPADCEGWLASAKSEEAPRGCDFIFHDKIYGGLYSVRSEELEESSLFQAVGGTVRRGLVSL
jgi:hypothetical protein